MTTDETKGTTGAPTERIAAAFARAHTEGRLALLPYVVAGYPDAEASEALALALCGAGADLLALGVPSDDQPVEGATAEAASQRALDQGMTLTGALEIAGRVAARVATPFILVTTFNPVSSFGLAHFCEAGADVGVAGLIIPDLPPEEVDVVIEHAAGCGLAHIFRVTPTSDDPRLAQVARVGSGFVYCAVPNDGTDASAQAGTPESLAAFLARVRAQTPLPLAVDFAASAPERVADLAAVADGAMITSALLDVIDAAPRNGAVQAAVGYLQALQAAAKRPTKG